jgi:hypothetical protein
MDGRMFLAAALVAAWIGLVLAPGWAGYGVILVMICACIVTIIRGYTHFLTLHRAMGTVGWVALALALWGAASIFWSAQPDITTPIVIVLCGAVLLGVPAIFLAGRLTSVSAVVVPTLYGAFAIVAILVFEAASDGALRGILRINGPQFSILYVLLSIFMWPVAALVQRAYGWKEAALWLVICLAVLLIAAGPIARIVSVVGLVCFLLCFISIVLTRLMLLLALLAWSFGPAVAVTLYGDRMNGWILENGTNFPYLTNKVDAWRAGLASWAGSPLLGWGAGIVSSDGAQFFSTASVQTSAFLELMLGTGIVGLMLAILGVCFLILRCVQGPREGWRLPAAAAIIGTGLAIAVSGLGFWQGWVLGAFVLSGLAVAGCRPIESKGASLGSIFDSARNDPTLYHFDNDLYEDDDPGDDEYEPEDDDDYDEDGPDERNPDLSRQRSHALEESHSSTETSEEDEEWQIDVDPLDSDKRR